MKGWVIGFSFELATIQRLFSHHAAAVCHLDKDNYKTTIRIFKYIYECSRNICMDTKFKIGTWYIWDASGRGLRLVCKADLFRYVTKLVVLEVTKYIQRTFILVIYTRNPLLCHEICHEICGDFVYSKDLWFWWFIQEIPSEF